MHIHYICIHSEFDFIQYVHNIECIVYRFRYRETFPNNEPRGCLTSMIEVLNVLGKTRFDFSSIDGDSPPHVLWTYVKESCANHFSELAKSRSIVYEVKRELDRGKPGLGATRAFTSHDLSSLITSVLGAIESDLKCFNEAFPVISGKSLISVSAQTYHHLLTTVVRAFTRVLDSRATEAADADAFTCASSLRQLHDLIKVMNFFFLMILFFHQVPIHQYSCSPWECVGFCARGG